MNMENINSNLSDLIHHLHDSRNGYIECADNVTQPSLKNLFINLANKREKMVDELKNIFNNHSVSSNGTIKGRMHQFFVNLKGLLTGKDTDSIIQEVRRGENILIDNYRDVLKTNLSVNARTILQNQLQTVESDLNEIIKRSLDIL